MKPHKHRQETEAVRGGTDLSRKNGPLATPIYLYHGSKDDTAPCAHVDLYKNAISHAQVRKLEGRDHQLNNDLSEVAADIIRIV